MKPVCPIPAEHVYPVILPKIHHTTASVWNHLAHEIRSPISRMVEPARICAGLDFPHKPSLFDGKVVVIWARARSVLHMEMGL